MSKQDYIDLDFTDIKTFPSSIKRRHFLKLLGSGIIILFSLDSSAFQEVIKKRGYLDITAYDLTSFLRIGEDGRITCLTGKIEMGQGIATSLSQIIADELYVPMESVDLIMGDTDLCPWDLGTFGSMTIRFFGVELRNAAAEARAVLLELASKELNVPEERLSIENGIIFDESNKKKKISYSELSRKENIRKRLDKKALPKNLSKLSFIGKNVKRIDASAKVTGKAKYAGDIQLPDMLYAKILRPPAHKAKLKSIDVSTIKENKDIIYIEKDNLKAVLHRHPDMAQRALSKIKADYVIPTSSLNENNIASHLLKLSPKGRVSAKGGNLNEGKKLSSLLFNETYSNGYVAHAPIETHTATAKWVRDRLTIWASTQTPFLLQGEISRYFRIPQNKVHIITPFVGGGFGGKTENNQALEAAILAKEVGKPVQVMRSREEEFFYDIFMPASVVKIKSGINGEGKIVYWDYKVYFAGERGGEHFYDIPHYSTTIYAGGGHGSPDKRIQEAHPFATGPWRAPANNTNTFARESQIDIMAEAAGIDKVEFRLKNLTNKRMIKVLEAVAKEFSWKPMKKDSSIGYGVACSIDADTYVAMMCRVKVDMETGKVKVEKVVCAQDMGMVVNPEGARMQIEGCITMGIGYALFEEIHFQGGRIFEKNFDTYRIPTFKDLPEIETILVDNQDSPPHGGGEPAITCMGAVIANAVYDAVGVRIFKFPLTAQRIKDNLKKINKDISS
ncbi:MAG: hypothetical protein D6734_07045 [Candidatus Schekmanbacteria bacterium]|nr:MAG: hypothetical protein D6734_07045 [Candidatus Schekmanbacteria bacterium]